MHEKTISYIINKYDNVYLTSDVIDNIINEFIKIPNFDKEETIRCYFDKNLNNEFNREKVVIDLFNIINKSKINVLDYLKDKAIRINKCKYVGIGLILFMILMFILTIIMLSKYLRGEIFINIGLLILDIVLFFCGIALSIDFCIYVIRLLNKYKNKYNLLVITEVNVYKSFIEREQKKLKIICRIFLSIFVVIFVAILILIFIIFKYILNQNYDYYNAIYFPLLVYIVIAFIITSRILIGSFVKKVLTSKILIKL